MDVESFLSPPSGLRLGGGFHFPERNRMNLAIFDEERRYRYLLTHTWDPSLPTLAFVMLNPSTADEDDLDPTLRRCKGFAMRDGYGAITIYNLFAYRATKPKVMFDAPHPVGPANDAALANIGVPKIVAAWGDHANRRPDRVERVLSLLPPTLLTLGFTKGKPQPRHPLYVDGNTPLEVWTR